MYNIKLDIVPVSARYINIASHVFIEKIKAQALLHQLQLLVELKIVQMPGCLDPLGKDNFE